MDGQENDSEGQRKILFILKLLDGLAERLKWFVLYYFIFEMQSVRIKLESTSME
jgi:hypothetical protein